MQSVPPRKSLTVLLILFLALPQSLFAQTRHPVQPKKTPRADQIAAAIKDLLAERPLDPASPDEQETAAVESGNSREEKPPADDAPIEKLLAYWATRGYSEFEGETPKPSEKVRERFLEVFENRPWLSLTMPSLLPDTPDTYDRLYKLLNDDPADQANWKNVIRFKLKQSSSYYREELINDVRNLSKFNYSDLSSLRALIRLDWETAKPFVEEMAGNPLPHVAIQGQALLYGRASQSNDSAQAEAIRAQLKAIVANRLASYPARQSALDSLMNTEWAGRDEWYVSLFADATLSGIRLEEKKDTDTSKAELKEGTRKKAPVHFMDEEAGMNFLWPPLLTNNSNLVSVVIGLIGNGDRTVHLAAVSCVVQFLSNQSGSKETQLQVARALLPWLGQPDWAGETGRWSYIESLAKLDLPESVAGLIWVLDYDQAAENRATAAAALVRYKNPQAIPALHRALNRENDEMLRESIIVALAELGGFADADAAAAIEAYCKRRLSEEGRQEISDIRQGGSEKSLPLPISIGAVYAESEEVEIPDSLATLLFNRAKALRKSQPLLAKEILAIAQQSSGIVADLNLADCIAEGWVDVEMLKTVLESRAEMRKRVGDKLEELLKQGGYQAGLAAAILNEEEKRLSVLSGKDTNAQYALLAAARYTREKLPVEIVGKLMNANAVQATAIAAVAESYLEAEDSAESRKLIWARHPGEAKILGEQFNLDMPPGMSPPISLWEEKMRKEVRSPEGPEEIYAVVPSQSPEMFNSILVRVRKNTAGTQAEISLQQAEGRRQMRMLTADELQELKEFTAREDVDGMKPVNWLGEPLLSHHAAPSYFEYLRLTKDGGRRIRLNQVGRTPKKDATLQEQLAGLFYRLSRSGEFKLRYALEDKIPGVEVLVAEDKRQVYAICQEAGQLRVMVSVENENPNLNPEKGFEWRELVDGRLVAPVDEPPNCQPGSMVWNRSEWVRESRMKFGAMFDPRAKLGNAWFAQSNVEGEPGIWKFEDGQSPVKIAAGIYGNQVLTPDGKWLIAKKTIQSDDNYETRLVRIHLPSGREYPINLAQTNDLFPVAHIAAHNKLLLSQYQYQYRPDVSGGNFYLLDAATGATQPIKGEFRPLMNAFSRPLQPTEKPNEFWAAIHDAKKKATAFGRYDTRTFSFTPVVELPEIRLNSADTWADAAAGKLYFVYLGHLLRVPLMK